MHEGADGYHGANLLSIMAYCQVFYFDAIYRKARSMATWGDSLRAMVCGPSWSPGAPRLGDPDTFPEIKAPRAKYGPQLPLWQLLYVGSHLMLAFAEQQFLVYQYKVSCDMTAA